MTQEEKQMTNQELDIPDFLKGKVKSIITMPEPDIDSIEMVLKMVQQWE